MSWRRQKISIRINSMKYGRNSQRYLRQTLALFFIVSLVPALVVAAVWYVNGQNGNDVMLDLRAYVLPIMVLGILPAIILSFLFR